MSRIARERIKIIGTWAMSHRWFHNSKTQFIVYDWSILRSDSKIDLRWFSQRNKGIVQAEAGIRISASISRKEHPQLGGKSFRKCTWYNMENCILVLSECSIRLWKTLELTESLLRPVTAPRAQLSSSMTSTCSHCWASHTLSDQTLGRKLFQAPYTMSL